MVSADHRNPPSIIRRLAKRREPPAAGNPKPRTARRRQRTGYSRALWKILVENGQCRWNAQFVSDRQQMSAQLVGASLAATLAIVFCKRFARDHLRRLAIGASASIQNMARLARGVEFVRGVAAHLNLNRRDTQNVAAHRGVGRELTAARARRTCNHFQSFQPAVVQPAPRADALDTNGDVHARFSLPAQSSPP